MSGGVKRRRVGDRRITDEQVELDEGVGRLELMVDRLGRAIAVQHAKDVAAGRRVLTADLQEFLDDYGVEVPAGPLR